MSKTFKPILAGKFDAAKQKFPVLASAKLDGVRCIIIDGVAMSRSLKPIPNAYVQKMIGKDKYNGLDGELMVGFVGGKDVYRNTVSAVMSEDGEPNFTFWVFDMVPSPTEKNHLPYFMRLANIKKFDNAQHINVLPHKEIKDMDALDAFEAKQLERGLEGVILRSIQGPYKFGRSSTNEGILLKLKRFEDSEAEIIGVEELLSNQNDAKTNALGRTERSSHKDNMVPKGTMGALNVRDLKTKVEFSIGTGFDADTREDFWIHREIVIGKIVKYKYFASGSKDKPRFPVYLGFRDKRDM
jgi:DNA ligase 1